MNAFYSTFMLFTIMHIHFLHFTVLLCILHLCFWISVFTHEIYTCIYIYGFYTYAFEFMHLHLRIYTLIYINLYLCIYTWNLHLCIYIYAFDFLDFTLMHLRVCIYPHAFSRCFYSEWLTKGGQKQFIKRQTWMILWLSFNMYNVTVL